MAVGYLFNFWISIFVNLYLFIYFSIIKRRKTSLHDVLNDSSIQKLYSFIRRRWKVERLFDLFTHTTDYHSNGTDCI